MIKFTSKKYFLISLIAFFFPLIVSAEQIKDFAELVGLFTGLLGSLVPLLVSLAVLTFLIGITKYVWKGENEAEREKGKKLMVWGIIGLFVMVSFWGLVGLLDDTIFGTTEIINNSNIPSNDIFDASSKVKPWEFGSEYDSPAGSSNQP